MIADRMLREKRSTLANPDSWLVEALAPSSTWVGRTLTPDQALGVTAVYAAVRVVSETVGMLPLVVYQRGSDDRKRAAVSWQHALLSDRPNPEQAPGALVEMISTHLELWGNAYVEKVKASSFGAGRVAEVWTIHPRRVQVTRDAAGRKRFRIDGGERTFGEDTILHIPGFSTDNLTGLSTVGVCRQQLGVMDARTEHEANLLRRGAKISGVIQRPKDAPAWSTEAKQKFVAQWRSAWEMGGSRAGGTPVLEDGMEWKGATMPMKDLQFVESRGMDVAEVARMFRIPASLIGGPTGDSLTYGNREQDATNLLTFSILPRLRRIEGAFYRDPDLFATTQMYPEFLVDGMLRADSQSRAATYTAALNPQTGWMSRDEVRRLENLAPDVPKPVTEEVAE